ncbi:amino acid racemase [Lentilactobacillus diolivorans]|uniref:aspartate/glutamate racemase family protein n=1 Tax=Lentilactobacillus diolivorans TaxID=179838 RepID=UPI0024690EF6|nr:amino acid racemase [Lentilactobacillus diolivorans]MDH5106001.1 amino acid racemase [Lentilactobacillus diolivorans]
MEKLGIIGGTGPESTLAYYRQLNYGYQKRLSCQDVFPSMTIESINIYEMLRGIEQQDWHGTVRLLAAAVDHLKGAGATFATLSAITPHIVFDKLQKVSSLPMTSMLQLTAQCCVNCQYQRPLLLGTSFTMANNFFINVLVEAGIDVRLPNPAQQAFIGAKIMNELEKGQFKDSTRDQFINLINEIQRTNGIDSVILGCTELPMLIKQDNLQLPVLDPMQIHIQYLLDRMTSHISNNE